MKNIDVIIGTEIKLNLHIDPIGDTHMTDYQWSATIYTNSVESGITMQRDDCLNDVVLTGKDNYIIPIDTSNLEPGIIKIKVIAYIPDEDFEDKLRTEIQIVTTNVKLKQ